jgi:hypothetical protein
MFETLAEKILAQADTAELGLSVLIETGCWRAKRKGLLPNSPPHRGGVDATSRKMPRSHL